jgi:Uma2 family endonuclease
MTWEEFIAWDVEGKTEWVDGEGIAHVSNSERHAAITVFLTELLGLYVRVLDLGRLFVESMLLRLPERPSGRMPDLFVIAKGDLDRVRHQWVEGPAFLAVEVVSEESAGRDLVEKRAEYERTGIAEYLTVEARPGRQGVTLLRLGPDGRYGDVAPDAQGRLHSTALPSFWLDPAWLEQDPAPSVERLMLRIAPEAYRAYLARILADDADSSEMPA